jgi:hypothetical protein
MEWNLCELWALENSLERVTGWHLSLWAFRAAPVLWKCLSGSMLYGGACATSWHGDRCLVLKKCSVMVMLSGVAADMLPAVTAVLQQLYPD